MATTTDKTSAAAAGSSSNTTMRTTDREVVDPVTHLPLVIHDNTSSDVQNVSFKDTTTADSTPNFIASQFNALISEEIDHRYWRYPEFEHQYKKRTALLVAVAAGAGGAASLFFTSLFRAIVSSHELLVLAVGGTGCCALALVAGVAILHAKVPPPQTLTEGEDKDTDHEILSHQNPETAAWLNAFVASLWPIVNPSLFTAVSDMLEDALQGSLPKFIHGVRVADLGQGSEPLRILGVRSLKEGDAGKDSEGMQAEEGDFVNLELAVAYRAQSVGRDLSRRSRNAHLLVEFFVSGGVVIPVWVEITGILASLRVRIQLTPNPPFLAAMTLTFLGQPKVTVECTPLSKNFLNVMDIPGLSKWLQSAIDGSIEAYVAPRSLNLDLKTMLSGREKLDTDAIGVIIVTIKNAKDFKDGDDGKVWQKKDKKAGDPYVTVGWGKWGKAIWSTRIIENDREPVWEETTFILITAAETNAREKLQLQLWDSDRLTADDLLGNVEVPLTYLMNSEATANKMELRRDSLGDDCPGTLEWTVGYLSKTDLQHHSEDADELTKRIVEETEIKLREARRSTVKADSELEQEKKEDLKEKTDEIIAGHSPSIEWPSGILSVRVEQITDLGVQKVRESGVSKTGEEEESSDLPNAYCTIIINDERIYKTRTKMKSNKPYFNAGTERFVKNWQDCTVIIAVRDLRLHEVNPLLGVVVLPLASLFKDRSQVSDSLPLVGGIGYGRMRFSALWRSVQTRLSKELMGWDHCTLEIDSHAAANFELPADLTTCKIRFELGRGDGQRRKLSPHPDGGWRSTGERLLALAVRDRFAECLVITFCKRVFGPDSTEAWGIVWLRDLVDKEDTFLEIPIQKRDADALKKARKNVLKEENVVGKLKLRVKAWPGLSGYHARIAKGDPTMIDVMEVLDCAEESLKEARDGGIDYDSDASSSSSSSSSESDTSSNGRLDGLKDQMKKKSELHRHHRGLMQWSGIRKLDWIKTNVEDTKDGFARKVKGKMHHAQKERDIEHEV